MKKIKILTLVLCGSIFFNSNAQKGKTVTVSVKNGLEFERTFETVVLSKSNLRLKSLLNIGIKDKKTGLFQVTQLVDNDGDGEMDDILFQPKVKANTVNKYVIVNSKKNMSPKADDLCFSRFVPERTDDYTWENNRVAFRVYGPNAQQLKEVGDPNGTLSSGVDAWLKKVEYPIINKWYKKTMNGTGTYHEDTGEGLDDFHVGDSRGVGGLATKVDGKYYYSKNYTKWRTITTGPLRTSFYLEYANWDAAGNKIKESKIISLDLGSNFSKFTTYLDGVNEISAGLTLHEKDGEVTGNDKNGWVSYWQPHGKSELGTAVIATKNTFVGFEKYDTEQKDLSNAYAHLKVKNKEVVYYAGFGWKGSGQFANKIDWENYLNRFSIQINNPFEVKISIAD